MSDKKLEFALQFSKAPKELQEAAVALQKAWARGDLAVAQLKLWKAEGVAAQGELEKLSAEFDRLLSAWDDGTTPKPKLQVLK